MSIEDYFSFSGGDVVSATPCISEAVCVQISQEGDNCSTTFGRLMVYRRGLEPIFAIIVELVLNSTSQTTVAPAPAPETTAAAIAGTE